MRHSADLMHFADVRHKPQLSDEQDMPFDEALALWSEMRYTPLVDIIRQRHVLGEFPGRTEADLYLWLCRVQEALEPPYDDRVLMVEAADDLAVRMGETRLPTCQLKKALRRITGRVVNWASGWGK